MFGSSRRGAAAQHGVLRPKSTSAAAAAAGFVLTTTLCCRVFMIVSLLLVALVHVEAFLPPSFLSRQRFVASSNMQKNLLLVQERPSLLKRWMINEDEDEDDEEDEDQDVDDEVHSGPLSKGVDSVSWLPTVSGAKLANDDTAARVTQPNAEILPLFPLGGIVYTPNSQHVLNIFEPRYRQMYSDILMNGTKRFVVSMSHPTEAGRFAAMGVLFELQELKEVSEQTGDQIKYICNHKVTGRVQMHRIVNPSAWTMRDTYLRVEGTIIDDSDKANNPVVATDSDDDEDDDDENDDDNTDRAAKMKKKAFKKNDVYAAVAAAASSLADGFIKGNPHRKEEHAVREAFFKLVELQYETKEDVRFTRGSVPTLPLKDGPGEDGLWQTIKLWQSFAEQRLMARQNELQQDFQTKLRDYLKKERGLQSEKELPSVIGFQDLSPALRQEVKELQKRMVVELQPLVLESTLTMQKILEAKDHAARLKLFLYFLQAETKRLETKRALKGMFKSTGSTTTGGAEKDKSDGDSSSSSSSATIASSKSSSSTSSSSSSSSSSLSSSSTSKMPREEQLLPPPPPPPSASSSSSSSASIFADDEDAFQ